MEKLKSGCHRETHCHFSLVLTQPDTSPRMILGTFNDFLTKCAKILTMAKYYWCCYMLRKSLKSFSSDNDSEMGSHDWPPFRKVGTFDPFTDDPRYSSTTFIIQLEKSILYLLSHPLSNENFIERFAIKTVDICCSSGLLLIGGMAGQLLICSMDIKRV